MRVILEILEQINKKNKMTVFAPIYYLCSVLIDSCMHIYFLNRVRLFLGINFESYNDLFFEGGGST